MRKAAGKPRSSRGRSPWRARAEARSGDAGAMARRRLARRWRLAAHVLEVGPDQLADGERGVRHVRLAPAMPRTRPVMSAAVQTADFGGRRRLWQLELEGATRWTAAG